MHLAVLVADRDIFADPEGMAAEAVAGFVVVLGGVVIVENPARVLGAAGLVNELTELVVLAAPEPPHAAIGPVLAPEFDIDMVVVVERGDELIAVLGRTVGEFLRTRQVEADALELVRQTRHERNSMVRRFRYGFTYLRYP